MADAAKATLKANQPNRPIEIEVYKENAQMAQGNCSGIM